MADLAGLVVAVPVAGLRTVITGALVFRGVLGTAASRGSGAVGLLAGTVTVVALAPAFPSGVAGPREEPRREAGVGARLGWAGLVQPGWPGAVDAWGRCAGHTLSGLCGRHVTRGRVTA
ncbi:hypothetical protein E0L36_20765 [Streptomyces sp. AJS327]|uniref:hypothetical protein n=1 Tax=Streptomyces sp. AJS327 TaxID=2545265 RepID=UPI0015DE27B3|nr:hypothetical protein [Streptomyces sp. AJS327]MBA0053216.1 hypothetical protein [Streptomyces sp. AJS327]